MNKAETKMYEATNRVASDIAAKVEQAFDDPVRYTVEAVEAWNELTSNNKPLTNLEKDIMASYLNDGILISTEEVA